MIILGTIWMTAKCCRADDVTDNRATPRRRVLKSAFIVLSEKAPKVECVARNVSDIGAALEMSTTYGVPTNFDASIDGVRRRCRVVWRSDTRLGVMFE